jgi:hypothetical protein
LFSEYPFGTDLTREEIELAGALRWLKDTTGGAGGRVATIARALLTKVRAEDRRLLARLQLAAPKNAKERLSARLVSLALRASARRPATTSRTDAQDP